MKHHLVAGGAGFIGSHLVDALLAQGDRVTIVDNLSTGRVINIRHLDGDERVRFVDHDLVLPLPESLRSDGFNTVLHLASPASPAAFLAMPLEILDVGAAGTRHLLDLAVEHGARFLLASTSEVYGDPAVHPQPESYLGNVSSTGPRSCYDEAKRYAEALTMAYHRTRGLDVRIARPFNTYGERMDPADGRVINTLLRQALAGQPLTLFGDGSHTRSFCHVQDQVSGLLALLDGPITGPVNIGNPDERSMIDLARLLIDLTGSSSQIQLLPLPPERQGDPRRRCPDISLARSELGWTPTVKLDDGLRTMIEWFRRHESTLGDLNAAADAQ